MFEWCITVVGLPLHQADGQHVPPSPERLRRRLYVWTMQESALDAFDEALRVLQGWPSGCRPIDVTRVGMYLRAIDLEDLRPDTPAEDGPAAPP